MFKVNYIEEVGSKSISEDKIIIKDNLSGIFDGASSLVKYADENGHTGGFLASKIVKDYFEQHDGDLVELALCANKKLNDEMIKKGIDIQDKLGLWSSTVAVVRINETNFEWVQICDSFILVIYKDDSFKLISKGRDHDKETLVMWKEYADKKGKNIREKLTDQLKKVRMTANISYGVLNGDEKAANFLDHGVESLENIKNILIFSDGFLIPKEDPEADNDFKTLVDLFLKNGLVGVKEYIRRLEKEDPECWKYIRLKQHDDIAVVALTFNE